MSSGIKACANSFEMIDPKWMKMLPILLEYKFGNKGTAESTADEIWDLFKDSKKSYLKWCMGGQFLCDKCKGSDKKDDLNGCKIRDWKEGEFEKWKGTHKKDDFVKLDKGFLKNFKSTHKKDGDCLNCKGKGCIRCDARTTHKKDACGKWFNEDGRDLYCGEIKVCSDCSNTHKKDYMNFRDSDKEVSANK